MGSLAPIIRQTATAAPKSIQSVSQRSRLASKLVNSIGLRAPTTARLHLLRDTPVCTEKDVSMDLEGWPLEVSIDERQVAVAHNDGEQNHIISTNMLSQSDLNYIINTVREISNVEIEYYYLTTPICENETSQTIPENWVSTPMPSPCMSFGDAVNECNYLSEGTILINIKIKPVRIQ
ncbi:unnamed protein product [Parnassius apollo]|uniref:(apollo) hypothetical protein n=1 Tax=Parnassius apollo TaxID=110799 RepID=A0A8S3W4C7_PARAO|nr:unnamed protein product [Parnassius apollo]